MATKKQKAAEAKYRLSVGSIAIPPPPGVSNAKEPHHVRPVSSTMANLVLIATTLLPVGWLLADIWGSPAARRTLGVISILWSYVIAYAIGSLKELDSNAYFGSATKDLIECSVQQMQAERSEIVQREWTRINEEYQPTYENRGHYREIVDEAIERMKQP